MTDQERADRVDNLLDTARRLHLEADFPGAIEAASEALFLLGQEHDDHRAAFLSTHQQGEPQ